MKIQVPFTYTAQVVKPKCRNHTPVLIQDSITVNIKEYDALPVALKALGTDYLWDNKSLWVLDYKRFMENNKAMFFKVEANTVKENTENYGKNYECSKSGAEAPFFDFWWDAKLALERGEVVSTKEEAIKNSKMYFSDNKNEVINQIKEIANNIVFINGLVYKRAAEPRYYTITFGLGNNHGSTSLSISDYFNSNIDMHSYFTALQYEEAKKFAIDVATCRRDTDCIPRIGEDKIEVLIPEAVKLKIKKLKLKY